VIRPSLLENVSAAAAASASAPPFWASAGAAATAVTANVRVHVAHRYLFDVDSVRPLS
jgi:hypothetical protein